MNLQMERISKNYKWSTPIRDYNYFGNVKLALHGEAIWHKPENKYIYGKLRIKNVEYNVTSSTLID